MPLERLPFPSVVVASRDDRYISVEQAQAYAHAWGSRIVDVGAIGHISAASGLGDWPAGDALLSVGDTSWVVADASDPVRQDSAVRFSTISSGAHHAI